jgi:hypothetical protein
MISIWPVRRMTNAGPLGGCERRATGMRAGRVKRWGGRGRVAALLAVGLVVALLTAGPVHAQTPIVPDLSGTQFVFNWYDNQYHVVSSGLLAIRGVDVYTGNFTGFLIDFHPLQAHDERTGAVTGQFLPHIVGPGDLEYDLRFTVSSPTDLWTYRGTLVQRMYWSVKTRGGDFAHTDPRDPDFYDGGHWDMSENR